MNLIIFDRRQESCDELACWCLSGCSATCGRVSFTKESFLDGKIETPSQLCLRPIVCIGSDHLRDGVRVIPGAFTLHAKRTPHGHFGGDQGFVVLAYPASLLRSPAMNRSTTSERSACQDTASICPFPRSALGHAEAKARRSRNPDKMSDSLRLQETQN
jgi:hypothetical protein